MHLHTVFWAYISDATQIHLTPGRFRLGAAFPSRSNRRLHVPRRLDPSLQPASVQPSPAESVPTWQSDLSPWMIGTICIECWSPRGRDSAPPLHVMVPPREFDGLPSAGAAPALWTGTQKRRGTDPAFLPARTRWTWPWRRPRTWVGGETCIREILVECCVGVGCRVSAI